jgi:phosphoribosylformimino-5-aminoimidazole carboxamide ribotide isomerase
MEVISRRVEIYPAIDLRGGQCVRLNQGHFDAMTTYSSHPVEVAQRWKAAGAKWLHIVDLDGAKEGRPNPDNLAVLAEVAQETHLPIQFGGGVRTAESAEKLFALGVTRVVLGTSAVRNPKLTTELFVEYGERIAVGVDARDGVVAVQGWLELSGVEATHFVLEMAERGAKRFIFTDIARDGMLQGVNIEALAQVARAVPQLPLIASGGVTSLRDLQLLQELQHTAPNVDGVIIGKALYTGALDLSEALRLVSA